MKIRFAEHATALSVVIYTLMQMVSSSTETVIYQYDELGRLKQVDKSGGPANGNQTTTSYDPAGNRTNQTTTVPPPPPPPSPPPPPP